MMTEPWSTVGACPKMLPVVDCADTIEGMAAMIDAARKPALIVAVLISLPSPIQNGWLSDHGGRRLLEFRPRPADRSAGRHMAAGR
jgi:hypothetical protein